MNFKYIISNKTIDELNGLYFQCVFEKEEILIFRKTINSMAERDFFLGINRIVTNDKLCKLANEGRLWKTIGNNMESYDIFKLWCEYKKQVDLGNIFIIAFTIEFNFDI